MGFYIARTGGQNTISRGFDIPWYGGQNTINRRLDIPWIQFSLGSGFDIPWIRGLQCLKQGVQHTMSSGSTYNRQRFDIQRLGGQHIINRRCDIPWVGGSIFHRWFDIP